ncbi:hypothetical protein SDC9_212673 [bioreactor metagenome]|uniref:Uncharacterized protein n=1 Tax=bioreactor metagenome TaxID=1076179 RepID=A0A645JML2_9ZZZZ
MLAFPDRHTAAIPDLQQPAVTRLDRLPQLQAERHVAGELVGVLALLHGDIEGFQFRSAGLQPLVERNQVRPQLQRIDRLTEASGRIGRVDGTHRYLRSDPLRPTAELTAAKTMIPATSTARFSTVSA